jgi:hypothetical protein
MRLLHLGFVTASTFACAFLGTTTHTYGAGLDARTGSTAESGEWHFTFAPYGWATWLKGDQTVKGRTVGLEVDPLQVIEHLEAVPFMGYSEARRGPLAFYGDIVYAKLGLDAEGVTSRSRNRFTTRTLSASLGLEFEQTVAEFGGTYEMAKWQGPASTFTAFDVVAGARYWHQHMSIDFALTTTLDIGDLVTTRGIAVARSGSVDWIDPIVGGSIRHQLAPGQQILLRADVGGFGVGSEFSWNLLAAYSFEICTQDGVTYSGLLGYRALDVDYEQGSGRSHYEYDMLQHGPLSGLTVRF